LIVLDASAAVDWLLRTQVGQQINRRIYLHGESLHAPHLLDVEVSQVLRREVREKRISADRGAEAIHDLILLDIRRYPHTPLLSEIWQHRHTLSAYDAAYVVLTEILGATLLTRDARLAAAHGHSANIELF
jgi:predicted nucleic acid-binding protein